MRLNVGVHVGRCTALIQWNREPQFIMLTRLLVLLALTLGTLHLSGCSRSPHDRYVGSWEQTDSKNIVVVRISRDGDTYLLHRSVVPGGDDKPIVLAKSDTQLMATGFFSQVPLGVSADGKTLRIRDAVFSRINDGRVDALKTEYARRQTQCKEWQALAREEAKRIDTAERDFSKRIRAKDDVRARYSKLASEMGDCVLNPFL